MELDELKQMWSHYDQKLEKSLKMNRKLFRELNLNKAKTKLRKLLFNRLFQLVFQVAMAYILIRFCIVDRKETVFVILASILLFFVGLVVFFSVWQIVLILQIKFDYTGAIAPLQKKLEKLRILLIQYIKLTYLPIPLSPLFGILTGKIWFNYDLFVNSNSYFWIWSSAIGVLLAGVVVVIFYQISQREIKPFWVRNILDGSGWSQLTEANTFLREINEFEKED